VATYLPRRNNKDCRKRWHYNVAHSIRKGTWTKEEDQRLREAVEIHGARWSKIAQVVGSRNGDQCWKRWYDCLDPRIDKSPWTPEEVSGFSFLRKRNKTLWLTVSTILFQDAHLLLKVAKHGRSWTEISQMVGSRSGGQYRTSLACKNRYSILQRKQLLASQQPEPAQNLTIPSFTVEQVPINEGLSTPGNAMTGPEEEMDVDNETMVYTSADMDDLMSRSFVSEGWYGHADAAALSESSSSPDPTSGSNWMPSQPSQDTSVLFIPDFASTSMTMPTDSITQYSDMNTTSMTEFYLANHGIQQPWTETPSDLGIYHHNTTTEPDINMGVIYTGYW